jgi:hypothetical protein
MKFWRSTLPTIAALFITWHITAGAVVPMAIHVLELSSTSSSSDRSETSTPEVCEHHAMPGAICPMHSKPRGETSESPACAMVACDSATGDLFALLAWNGLFEPPVELDTPLLTAERHLIPDVQLLHLSTTPTTPPPRL